MNRFITFLVVFLTAIIALPSCERDEVCIDPITPKLIVVFYDIDDPEAAKSVNNLAIEIIDKNGLGKSLDTIGTDSIGIPLNVYELQTTIVLTENSKDNTLINRDTILVSYDTEEVFVGRSCGYKTVFKNVKITRTADSNIWLNNLELLQTEILNENNAHVKILH